MPPHYEVVQTYKSQPMFRFKSLRWNRQDDDLVADSHAISVMGFEPARLFRTFKSSYKIRPDLSRFEHVAAVQAAIGDRWRGVEFSKFNFYVLHDLGERIE